eukprot:scaffold1634_cov353-Prasinococcus_capsulatus_cf.AAC.9
MWTPWHWTAVRAVCIVVEVISGLVVPVPLAPDADTAHAAHSQQLQRTSADWRRSSRCSQRHS